MRVLVTGSAGYIGQVLVPMLQAAGHAVVGMDSLLFDGCDFPRQPLPRCPLVVKDIRAVERPDLAGFDAVVHLAGLSNDPLGELDPETTVEINHHASVRLAELARDTGVARFIFASSCSNYGAAGDEPLDETATLKPVTTYAQCKVWTERDVKPMADEHFCPVFLRNATAYGLSARFRGDLVVNNLTGYAFTTGKVLIKSDGTPWRPLVHIEDIALASLCVLEAPADRVCGEAFNVGITAENFCIREVADLVAAIVPCSEVTYGRDSGPDARNYRVNCDKLSRAVPTFRPRWSLEAGIRQLYRALASVRMTKEYFFSPRFFRLAHLEHQIARGALARSLHAAEPMLSR